MMVYQFSKRFTLVSRLMLLIVVLAMFISFESSPARSAPQIAINAAGYNSIPGPPGPLNFGEVQVGAERKISLEIFETGDDPLTIGDPLLSGDNSGQFRLETIFPITIPDGGASRSVDLVCSPDKPGLLTAQFSITANDPAQPSVTYNLICDSYAVLMPGPIRTGINGPYDLAISPDGQHLYTTSLTDNTLRVYKRSETSGILSGVMAYSHADLNGPNGVAISPDGNQVFLTSFLGDALLILNRDSSTGMVSTSDIIKDGDLIPCSPCPPCFCALEGLDGANGLAVSPDGKNIYVAATENDAVSIFSRSVPTGTVSFQQDFQEIHLGITGLAGAFDVAVSPDGYNVYVVSSPSTSPGGGGAVAVFRRFAWTGAHTFVEAYKDGGELLLDRPVAVTVNPNGSQVFVASYYDDTLMVFDRNPADGKLTVAQSLTDGGEIDGLDGSAGVAASPDGSQIYVSALLDDALSVFELDPISSQWGFAAVYRDGISWVEGLDSANKVTTSPEGKHVYVTGYLDNSIVAFRTLDKIYLPMIEK